MFKYLMLIQENKNFNLFVLYLENSDNWIKLQGFFFKIIPNWFKSVTQLTYTKAHASFPFFY
jgi:hypothetical protein